jgi:hypothetical protein
MAREARNERAMKRQLILLRTRMVLLIVLLGTGVVSAGDERAAQVALEQINQRWEGAICELRVPIEFKKGKDRKGWSKSPWLVPPQSGAKEGENTFRVFVSDRAAIARLLDGKTLTPGTRFVAEGWAFEDFKNAEGLYLTLRFEDYSVKTQWRFSRVGSMSTKSFMSEERIGYVERYMRFEACKLSPRDETLEVVDPPTAATVSKTRPSPVQTVARPGVRIVAVAAQPPQVSRGAEMLLAITYEVTGLPPETAFEAIETRKLVQGAEVLASFEERIPRTSGTYTSELPVRVPENLGPGFYSFHASVNLAGESVKGEAFFQVVSDSGED